MTMLPQQSLFESHGGSSFDATIGWINSVLLGELAIGLGVLAVAVFGFSLLTGRLHLRLGGRVALGLFLLLGAPAIATAFSVGLIGGSQGGSAVVFERAPPPSPRQDLPPANYDPYAGASLRRD